MSDYVAIGSLLISFVAIIISIITNTKKYELTGMQRSELLEWFHKTVEILIFLRLRISENNDFDKIDYLSKLSALIEYGRFYFPNIDKGDNFGNDKPSAYRGHREVTLAFLIYSYDVFNRHDAREYIGHLERLQRLFTSRVYDILIPCKYNKLIKKNTLLSFDKQMSLEDFLQSDPQNDHYFPN